MDKDFTPYEIALALKELGFDELCLRFKNNISNVFEQKIEGYDWNQVEKFVSIPTFSQAFRFFREKYGLDSHIKKGKHGDYILVITGYLEDSWDEYEEAELECLKKLIEIVKSQS